MIFILTWNARYGVRAFDDLKAQLSWKRGTCASPVKARCAYRGLVDMHLWAVAYVTDS
jgi:hypothetical protein